MRDLEVAAQSRPLEITSKSLDIGETRGGGPQQHVGVSPEPNRGVGPDHHALSVARNDSLGRLQRLEAALLSQGGPGRQALIESKANVFALFQILAHSRSRC